MSALFAGGINAFSQELNDHGPWRLFCWMALIFLKAHLKNKYLSYHLDRRKGDITIAEIHSWEELYHLHCVARAFYSRAKIDPWVVGSLFIYEAKARPHFERFDFIDLTAAQTMLLRLDDVAVITVFNDSQAALNVANEDFERRIGGPLSPIQLREITAILASINLHVESRTEFFSEWEAISESYSIGARRPTEVLLRPWDDDLHGRVMYTATQGMLRLIRDGEELETLVKTGRYTFLTTPDGAFDVDSMELEPLRSDPVEDPSAPSQ